MSKVSEVMVDDIEGIYKDLIKMAKRPEMWNEGKDQDEVAAASFTRGILR